MKGRVEGVRVLLVPDVYRRDDPSANGTVTDAVAWVSDWLERAPSLHVYWLLPLRETADYSAADIRADRDRVTLLEAEPYGADLEWVEAHSNADRETYERALERGDLAICASEYETLARTWFSCCNASSARSC